MEDLLTVLNPILPATLAQGPTKFMGIVRLSDNYYGHRIDIRLVPAENYPFALLYFTGSQKFNILMRNVAISMGLKLNEYTLSDSKGKNYKANSEEDIFKILNLKYVAPKDRVKNIQNLI